MGSVKRNYNVGTIGTRVSRDIHDLVVAYTQKSGINIRDFYDKAAREKLRSLTPKNKNNAKVQSTKG